jgi:hypothetical protein
MPSVLLQQYVPATPGSDWMVNVYCNATSVPAAAFTGVKLRCWPSGGGVGSLLRSAPNDTIAGLTATLCRAVGYRGIADLDWRLDQRSGEWELLDFNPRVGAQFGLFRTDVGIDVVRALHLDLTGRPVPPGAQLDGRGLRVEHLDVLAAVASWRAGSPRASPPPRRGRTTLAWLAPDDPLPAVSAAIRSTGPAAKLLAGAVRAWVPPPKPRRPAGGAGR